MKPLKVLAILTLSLSLMLGLALTCQATTFVWVGGDGDWSVIANWECDPPGLNIPGPPGPGDTAVVYTGSPHVTYYFGGIAALTVDAGGQVFIELGSYFEAPTIHNDGLITVNDNGYFPTSLGNGQSDISLTSSGTLVLTGGGFQGRLPTIGWGPNGGILTNGPSHTIRGGGYINMPVQNYGRIIADNGPLYLQENCVGSPESVLAASGSNGFLYLTAAGRSYAGGQILPQDGWVVTGNTSFNNIYFGPGRMNGGWESTFYEGVTFAAGAQAFIGQMNMQASSGNAVVLTNNGMITASVVSTPNIATFIGTGTRVL